MTADTEPGNARLGRRGRQPRPRRTEHLARSLGLSLVSVDAFTLQRRRSGRGFAFIDAKGRPVRDARTLRRLKRLAVPPAYAAARYCEDPRGHIQAIWQDAAGRQQYRYHDDWETIRDDRRLRRLLRLAEALPRIRRAVSRRLKADTIDREAVLAAVVELVALTGIRAGGERYARINGSRGASTLLKSDVTLRADRITMTFTAKGGKELTLTARDRPLARTLGRLMRLPGRRLFQYRDADGGLRRVTAREANLFLRDLAGLHISLKDFRTLTASAAALGALARLEPAPSATGRKRQVRDTMRAVAERLGNTPAICRKSYVPAPLVEAFERGELQRALARSGRIRNERLLTLLLAEAVRDPR